MVLASVAFDFTLGLLITFGGIGVLVGALIAYSGAQAAAERQENNRLRDEGFLE